ncbi:hypothetical protein HPB47_003336 [Ixodes persulcatus]|uniref:Uncharacterized protein n=1 Tax=Ixodes persulcatus TaxID=34615 RepID=A0AC60PJT0_IXOPE|nr:hypothetical protein HPB47_003336 [Ixodes persulcatus]
MEMKEATPVPNFLRVSGHRANLDYRGLLRVCRRCQREGHIKAACNVPILHPLRRFRPRLRQIRFWLRTLRGGPRDGGLH